MLVQMPQERQRPTHVRYLVVVFAVALAVVTYIDRVCISFAAPLIRADLHLSQVQMGYAFSAFAWTYALFEIPGGFLGDWIGARRVLLRIVLWWSFFTAATGWAWSFASLAVTRSLFGAGEAGCFPNLTKTFTIWLPHHERVRAQGIMWLSARWGGAFTPPLVYLAIQVMSWRHAFELFGCIGVVWAILFYAWYRDHPRDNRSLNAAERQLLAPNESLASGHARVQEPSLHFVKPSLVAYRPGGPCGSWFGPEVACRFGRCPISSGRSPGTTRHGRTGSLTNSAGSPPYSVPGWPDRLSTSARRQFPACPPSPLSTCSRRSAHWRRRTTLWQPSKPTAGCSGRRTPAAATACGFCGPGQKPEPTTCT